jgi:hypothetical protein
MVEKDCILVAEFLVGERLWEVATEEISKIDVFVVDWMGE